MMAKFFQRPAAGMLMTICLAVSLAVCLAVFLAAGPAGASAADAPAVEQGSGPFAALYETDPGLPRHVVYRPKDLAADTGKLGVYIFGNGACSADGTASRNHLLEIASHGYLVIASGVIPSARNTPPEPKIAPDGSLNPPTTAKDLTDAIDWALRENSRPGSPYYGRIAPDEIAVSGWSCGGLQALAVAGDPRIRTLVIMNSGVIGDGSLRVADMPLSKADLSKIHGSVLYVLGGPADIAYKNGTDDYSRIDGLPAALVNIPVGHGGTYMQPHGGLAAEVVTRWLDWRLKGDAAAARDFAGPDCHYCHDPRLTLDRKGFQ